MNILPLVAGSAGIAMAMMGVVWFFAKRMNNAGIADIWWVFGFVPVAVFCGIFGGGHPMRNGLIAAMVCAWSVRLGRHLYKRVMGHHPEEDPRYAALRARFPRHPWFLFFWVFQLQGVLIALLSLPVALACANPFGVLGSFEVAGLLLWSVAVGGEAVADAQLASFRSHPANKGKVCGFGLWRYSRHPNYFFEWLVWVAFAVFALEAPFGWAGLLSPLLMLCFLTCVTGIPPSEARSLASCGDAYRDYQSRTSPFIPWFPRSRP